MFDYIPPYILAPLAIFLWLVVLMSWLVSLRRAKVRQIKALRLARRAARRESHIQLANEADTTITERKKR